MPNDKLKFIEALDLLEQLIPEEATGDPDFLKHAGNCNCQKCAYCAYWRLRELVTAFSEIRLNSRALDKHIQSLFE